MNINRFLPITALLLAGLGLSACNKPAPTAEQGAASDPVDAVQGLVQSLRDNDLKRFSRQWLPPAMRSQIEARFDAERAALPASSEDDQAQFAQMLVQFTGEGAEDKLMAQLEPSLAKFDKEMAAQLPMAVAMGSGFASAAINESTTLSDDEKQHASAVLAALTPWATKLPLGDREKARAAVGALVETMRALDLKDIDSARALPIDDLLDKAGIALAGSKKTLAIYGLDADAALASAKAELVDEADGQARVKVSYTLLDAPVSFEMAMVERDGLWYSADGVASAEKALDAALQVNAEPGDDGEILADDATAELAEAEAAGAEAAPSSAEATPGE